MRARALSQKISGVQNGGPSGLLQQCCAHAHNIMLTQKNTGDHEKLMHTLSPVLPKLMAAADEAAAGAARAAEEAAELAPGKEKPPAAGAEVVAGAEAAAPVSEKAGAPAVAPDAEDEAKEKPGVCVCVYTNAMVI